MLKHVLVAGVIGMGVVGMSHAAAQGVYIQGGIGSSSYSKSGLNKGKTVKVLVGQQFTDHLALEGQFTDLGTGKSGSGGTGAKVSAMAFGLNAVAALPFDRWVIAGKIGVHRVSTKLSQFSPASRNSGTENRFTPVLGGAVSYAFTRRIEGMFEIDRFTQLAKGLSATTAVVGIRYWL